MPIFPSGADSGTQDVDITNPDMATSTNQREGIEESFILYDILKELKIMNFHLSLLTDIVITKEEVE